jgi:hypothetical protein
VRDLLVKKASFFANSVIRCRIADRFVWLIRACRDEPKRVEYYGTFVDVDAIMIVFGPFAITPSSALRITTPPDPPAVDRQQWRRDVVLGAKVMHGLRARDNVEIVHDHDAAS